MQRVKIFREDLKGLCQEALDFFDTMTGGTGVFETDVWTSYHELIMQQQAPQFVAWLRAKRLVPFPNLEGVDLSGMELSNADLRGANLAGASMSGTVLEGARLERTVLLGCDLSSADVEAAHLDGAKYDGEPPAGWIIVDGKLVAE